MGEILTMALAAILINNVVLSKFLGVCPFLGVSKNSKSAIGMGLAVIFVIFGASLITYFLYYGLCNLSRCLSRSTVLHYIRV